ncbi:MAG: hypothetical protein LBK67_09105 [Coriobacteriales bacterium]|nr:hypothetical protein [Coriobacteriales bacterium]
MDKKLDGVSGRKKTPMKTYISRFVGALLLVGILCLVVATGEWVLLILLVYGLFFLLGGRDFFYK